MPQQEFSRCIALSLFRSWKPLIVSCLIHQRMQMTLTTLVVGDSDAASVLVGDDKYILVLLTFLQINTLKCLWREYVKIHHMYLRNFAKQKVYAKFNLMALSSTSAVALAHPSSVRVQATMHPTDWGIEAETRTQCSIRYTQRSCIRYITPRLLCVCFVAFVTVISTLFI